MKNNKSPKLMFVINDMFCFWTRRFPIAKQAVNEGYDVSVCASGAQEDEKLLTYGFRGYELPQPGQKLSIKSILSMLQIMVATYKKIREENPDIVHAMTLKYAFMTGLVCRFIPNVKVVHTIAGLGYLFSGEGLKVKILRGLISPFLKLSLSGKNTWVTFQNPDDMALMIKQGFVKQERSILIKGSGIDLEEFAFTPEAETDEPLVVMPTRLIHEKGIAVFIEACKLLEQKGVQARFQIAGGGAPYNPREITTDQMHAMLAGSTVEWLGHVDNIKALYERSHLVVYPSYYGEGVPKVLLEAASIGRPIITTDHPGCREAVNDGENGYLVPIKDPHATAKAMEKIITDTALRRGMGQKSRTLAENEFSIETVVAKNIEIYQGALK